VDENTKDDNVARLPDMDQEDKGRPTNPRRRWPRGQQRAIKLWRQGKKTRGRPTNPRRRWPRGQQRAIQLWRQGIQQKKL
jgi:hypothetical protein